MSISPQHRYQQQQHISPHQALHGGQHVSVKNIVHQELRQTERQQNSNQRIERQTQKKVGFVASPQYQQQQQEHHHQHASPAPAPAGSQWAQHALIPINDDRQQQEKKKKTNKRSSAAAAANRLNNPYELVKRAMATEENQRAESNQQLHSYLGQKTVPPVRSRNLRFQQHQQRQTHQSPSRGSGSAVLLRSANQQPTSFVSPTRAQQSRSSQDLRGTVNRCVRSEAGRIFLTEEEARALSGGRICYSVSQRTTAFGSSAPHTETVQEPFCLLAVNIARALVPGVSHCAMVRRAASLIAAPAWSQKLASGISLLAHGAVDIIVQSEPQPQEQPQPDEEASEGKDQKNDNNPEEQQQDQQLVPVRQEQQQVVVETKSHVQWAMLHVPMDMPTLFVAMYVPPAAEGLLPAGFTASDGAGGGSAEEIHRLQQQRAEEEERRRKRSHEYNFAGRFVGQVFHNIGLEDDDYDEQEDDLEPMPRQDDASGQHQHQIPPLMVVDQGEQQQQQQQQQHHGPDSGSPLGRVSSYELRHPDRSDKVYHNAGEFVDEVFDDLLGIWTRSRPGSAAVPPLGSPQPASPPNQQSSASEQQQQQQQNSRGGATSAVATNTESESRVGGLDTAGLTATIAKLHFQSEAHRDVARQVCLAAETFLTHESHGRKVRRLVVCAHSTSGPLASDVVTALRARQVAKGQSRRVMLVTTQANIASSVPRRRLEGKMRSSPHQTLEQLKAQQQAEERKLKMAEQQRTGSPSSSSASPGRRGGGGAGALTVVSPGGRSRSRQHGQQQAEQQQQQPEGKFSEWVPEERANALHLFFARLCIPVPKLSFDLERRRGWRFVVMPECMAWAMGYFAPGAVLSYQSLEFPRFVPRKDGDDGADQRPSAGLAPSLDDIVRHLWEALGRVEGCIDPVSGGATLEGFVLASTTLLAGLVSKEVADSIWDEVFASKFTASIYPPGTPIPTPPPACGCCGAMGADYYSAREATFVRQLRAHAPAAMKPFLKKALQRPFDPVPQQRASRNSRGGGGGGRSNKPRRRKGGSHAEMFFDRDGDDHHDGLQYSDDDDDADELMMDEREKEAAASWNRAFFAESFHPPFDVLARANAQFLPPLTALFSNSVARTESVYLKQGAASAATVRLRLQENLYRASSMAETFS